MLAALIRLLLTPYGREPRRVFWLASVALWFALSVSWWTLESAFGRSATWFVHVPFVWMQAMLAIKRLHDRARSGFWLLLVLVPLLGPLWLLVEFLLRGTRGRNRFGADPHRRRHDFHTVS
jgi:uncharacterized membrane protein YhaH (DUF805 family)